MEGVAEWLETHKMLPVIDATIVSATSIAGMSYSQAVNLLHRLPTFKSVSRVKISLRPLGYRKPRECNVNLYHPLGGSVKAGLWTVDWTMDWTMHVEIRQISASFHSRVESPLELKSLFAQMLGPLKCCVCQG